MISKVQGFKGHMTQRFAKISILIPGGVHREEEKEEEGEDEEEEKEA